MNFLRSSRTVLTAACLLLTVAAVDVAACPGCRETLPNGKQTEGEAPQANVAQGFAWSIYLMLAVPFTLAAAMGGAAFVLIRRASQQNPTDSAAAQADHKV